MKRNKPVIVKGNAAITSGDSFTIPIKTWAYQMFRTGIAKISIFSNGSAPHYKGAIGTILTPFSKVRYDSADNVTIITPGSAIAGINGGSTNFLCTGNTKGIQISTPGGLNDIIIKYELELKLELK